ncbi:UPF0590 protein [Lachnellula occidentalis]|uniref:UPF0590 protein n=1 Tax=Lachnellula occidentalis TaxID=215460 RepID=A0A8H8U840_9HELO|nr:UPF0590 protein [Lachnellula occidentalis]
MAHNYILQVTAGSEYDIAKHQIVPVNSPKPVSISSELIDVDLNVRVQVWPPSPFNNASTDTYYQSYRGLPRSSPQTSPYFSLPQHTKDQYSITFKFSPKSSISADDLVFGNDFDHPIRDRLPPGFGTAMRIVKWAVDPGLDGDVYAEKPYMYGPAASSVNTLHVGSMAEKKDADAGLVFDEGGDAEGLEHRKESGIPDDMAARKKYFLNEENRKAWDWEAGRTYGCDFFNPYLDFNGIFLLPAIPPASFPRTNGLQIEFALSLPGFKLPIMKYWDGQGLRKQQKRSHTLRYVLKNRKTDTVLFVVLFTLYLKDDVLEDGTLKDGVEGGKPLDLMSDADKQRYEKAKNGGGEGEEEEEVAVEKEKGASNGAVETSDDDVD